MCVAKVPPQVLFRNEVYAIVGAALEVLRELGHGIHEKPYERALAVELSLRNLPYQQQTPFDIFYKRQGRPIHSRPGSAR
jgi:GxxExxY protein